MVGRFTGTWWRIGAGMRSRDRLRERLMRNAGVVTGPDAAPASRSDGGLSGGAPSGAEDGARALVTRMFGAAARALLVVVLVILPSALLPGMDRDARVLTALIALLAGALVFIEYGARYPSLVEFRDAPPFNRIRFTTLFITAVTLSAMLAAREEPTLFNRLAAATAGMAGHLLDFPYSPVRLVVMVVGASAPPDHLVLIRSAAGMAYLLSLLSVGAFVVILRLGRWPSPDQPFNLWVNLPTFESAASRDVLAMLERDARVNLSLGFLLPFLVPAIAMFGLHGLVDPGHATSQKLVWMMAAWALVPGNLMMRGLALRQLALTIRDGHVEAPPVHVAAAPVAT